MHLLCSELKIGPVSENNHQQGFRKWLCEIPAKLITCDQFDQWIRIPADLIWEMALRVICTGSTRLPTGFANFTLNWCIEFRLTNFELQVLWCAYFKNDKPALLPWPTSSEFT